MTPSLSATHATESLTVTRLTKHYGGVTAASDVSLTIDPGRITALIGPNGAGKSTMVNMIAGFAKPDSGKIFLGTTDLRNSAPWQVAQLGVARTFQQPTPLSGLTVLENVMCGMHKRFHARTTSVLFRLPAMRREEKELTALAFDYLDKCELAHLAAANAADLTFGQLRFLEVARALASQPRMLLLDEPAAGLSQGPETSRLAEVIGAARAQGIGVLLVDHDMEFVFKLCDRVVVMDQGRVIADDAPEAVYSDQAVIEAYLGVTSTTEDGDVAWSS
jgi:branched-chain amino acid transport system ATP-binding protein